MIWEDKGYLLTKNKYNENSAIAEFFTQNNGKVVGVIFGATSKKIKNYLQIGNKFHLNYNSKIDGRIGYFKIEIDNVTTPYFLENKIKLSCIIYCMNLIKLLTVENQENIKIFELINDFFNLINEKNWIKHFVLWELQFYKIVGYDINFNNYVFNEKVNGVDKFFVQSNSQKRIIPEFLINKNKDPKNKDEIFEGLKLVGDFLNKSILRPNNINFPNSRTEFINKFK